jgi:hypothetical protein
MKRIQVIKVPGCAEHADNFVCEHGLQLLKAGENFAYGVERLDVQLTPNGNAYRPVELCSDCRKKYYEEGGYELVGGLAPDLFVLPRLPL